MVTTDKARQRRADFNVLPKLIHDLHTRVIGRRKSTITPRFSNPLDVKTLR
jgi:hypothetical protein